MLWTGLANFLKHGIPVQNEQGGAKPGVFHMELCTRYENRKSLSWQSRTFTENLTIGKIEYKISGHQLEELRSLRRPDQSVKGCNDCGLTVGVSGIVIIRNFGNGNVSGLRQNRQYGLFHIHEN